MTSCREPTEIVVEIRTDLPCSDPQTRVDWTHIAVGMPMMVDGKKTALETKSCKAGSPTNYIGNFVIVPSGRGTKAEVRVMQRATTTDANTTCTEGDIGKDCIVAKRVVQFLGSTKLRMQISLDRACLGKVCPGTQTCKNGACVEGDCSMNPALCMEMDGGAPLDATDDVGMDVADVAAPVPAIRELVAGGNATCSIHVDDTVRCWGDNSEYALAHKSQQVFASPVEIDLLKSFTKITLGDGFGCGFGQDEVLRCWGSDHGLGRLGRDTNPDGLQPEDVITDQNGTIHSTLSSVVALGANHACAQGKEGFFCWGDNSVQQLGGSVGGTQSNVAVTVQIGNAFVSVACGTDHCCGDDGLGAASCWGNNDHGQCGVSSVPIVKVPTPVEKPLGVKKGITLSAGASFTCESGAGSAYCWGADKLLQLGAAIDGGGDSWQPVQVQATSMMADPFIAVRSGLRHSCVSTQNGALKCWGGSDESQCGIIKPALLPIDVSIVSSKLVAIGARHVCVATPMSTKVYCFGANDKGQLGIGKTSGSVDAKSAQLVMY